MTENHIIYNADLNKLFVVEREYAFAIVGITRYCEKFGLPCHVIYVGAL